MTRRTVCAIAILCLAATGASPGKPHEVGRKVLPIAIVINGMRLPFNPPPRFYKNHLLVPVRRIIETLGLAFSRSGKTITTHAGYKTIALRIGSFHATIDGQRVELDAAPVEIANTLYAPLRFFTAALGAQAVFNRQSDSVEIVSTLVGRSGNGITENGSHVEQIGIVTAIDLNSLPPTITLTYNASVRTLPVATNARVVVQDVNTGTSSSGVLGDVHAGDFAHLYLNRKRAVERVVDAYGSRVGTLEAVADGQLVLGDGHVISPSRDTTITLNGANAAVGDLQVGDSVAIRYNIVTSEPRQIVATRTSAGTPAPPGGVAIASIEVGATRPLREGETFGVTLRGTPGGIASYDIGPYVEGLPMRETAPGVYTATYRIPHGANLANVPIFGHLSVGSAKAPRAESSSEISAASEPPGIREFAPDNGATVNNDRPSIYATFVSNTVAVNPSSITLLVNGHDVTSECTRSPRFIEYVPGVSMRDGPVRVTVRVADLAENTAVKTWTFFIKR